MEAVHVVHLKPSLGTSKILSISSTTSLGFASTAEPSLANFSLIFTRIIKIDN